MELKELSCIAYTRFINPDFKSDFNDDGRIFNKALPSSKPIKPGSNKPIISRSPFGPTTNSPHYKALDRQSKQGFRVSASFMDYVCSIYPRQSEQRKKWQDAIERSFLGLLRKKNELIYRDTFYDWRGRLYDMSGEWGSLQNNKLSRAALSAPEPYKVSKNSKAYSYMLRVFKSEGWPTTVDEARYYLGHPDFNGDGAIDWMAVKAALTLVDIAETGSTDYLIEQDARCSGFQHMALLTGDTTLAKMVIAIEKDPDDPEFVELYTFVAQAGNIANELFKGSAPKARSFTKNIVMLTGYGSGAHGLSCKYWLDYGGLGEIDDEGSLCPDLEATIFIGEKEFTFKELKSFVKKKQDILFNEFSSLLDLRKTCMKIFATKMKANPTVFSWEAPDGFNIVRLITKDEQLTNKVSAAGAMPNLIHSLDAAIIRYTIMNWPGVLGVVHDAFFSTVNDALEVRDIVRAGYHHVHANLGNFPIKNTKDIPNIGLCIGVA